MLKAHCAWCLRRGDKKCGQCGSVHYCSEECAYRDKRHHAPQCEQARAEGREAIISAMKHELKCKMLDADAMDIFMMAVKLGRVKLVTRMLNQGNIVFANDMNTVRLFTNFMGPLRTSSYAHSYMVYLTFNTLRKTCPVDDYGYWLKMLIINVYDNGITDTLKFIYNELLFVIKNQEKRKLTVIDAFMDKDLESTDLSNALVLAVIEAGADVNATDASANNVLHFYCIIEDFDENIVRTLIRAGINVNHKNCIGLTPLLNAFYRIKDEDMSAAEDSLLRCVSIFMEMAPLSIDYVSLLDREEGDLTEKTTQNIYGVLGVAVYRKCTKIVKMLIDGGFIQHLNVVLNHAIHYPSNKKECASILLACMDDSLLSSTIDEFRKTNLHPKTLNALHAEKAARRRHIKKKASVRQKEVIVSDEVREQALRELLAANTKTSFRRKTER